MALSEEKAAIFIDTSFGTHLAMAVSPQITAGDLKRKLRTEHFICFPNVGEIRITGLMVKRRSNFYHLPDLIPVKNVFEMTKGNWFLHMDGTPLNDVDEPRKPEGLTAKCSVSVSSGSDVINSREPEHHVTYTDKIVTVNKTKKRQRGGSFCSDLPECFLSSAKNKKERKMRKCFGQKAVQESEGYIPVTEGNPVVPLKEQTCCSDFLKEIDHKGQISLPTVETPSVSIAEVVSVSGIITRYFPEFDEVESFDCPSRHDVNDKCGASVSHECHQDNPLNTETNGHCSKILVHNIPQPTTPPLPPPTQPKNGTSRCKLGRTEVGKRFVIAASDLGICTSKKKQFGTTWQSKSGKFSPSLVKTLVFEMDNDDALSNSKNGKKHCSRNVLVRSR